MTKDAQTLLNLQEIDAHLLALQQEATKLKAKAQNKQSLQDMQRLKAQVLQLKGALTDKKLEEKGFEHLADDARREKAKVEEVLSQSSDYRRMESYEQQLATLEKRIEKNEFKRAGVKKECKKYASALQVAQAKLKDAEDAQTTNRELIKERLQEIVVEIRDLQAKHNELLAKLSSPIMTEYRDVQQRFQGRGIERIGASNKPSMCRVALQPSQITDVWNADSDIVRCPYCERILIKETHE